MRRLSIIGIGAGNPDHITMQAIKTLRDLDVVFLIDKGDDVAVDVRLTPFVADSTSLGDYLTAQHQAETSTAVH